MRLYNTLSNSIELFSPTNKTVPNVQFVGSQFMTILMLVMPGQ